MGKSLIASMKNQVKRQTGAKGKGKSMQQVEQKSDNNNVQDFCSLNQSHDNESERLRLKRLNLSDDDDDDGRTSGSSGRGCSGSSDEDTNSDEQAHKLSNESLAASSGRSSASKGDDSEHHKATSAVISLEAEPSWHSGPQQPEALALIEQVRARFWEALKEQEMDQYEPLDLDELRHSLVGDTTHRPRTIRLIGRFLNFRQLLERTNDVEHRENNDDSEETECKNKSSREKALAEAADKLREFLQFRCHYQLEAVRPDQFCKEIHQLHGIFPFGLDKNRLPVLYLRARVHRRWSAPLDEAFKRYVAWQVDMMTKSSVSQALDSTTGTTRGDGSFGICFDCLNVSYACVDMDFLSYLVKILVHYYPTYCRYALCVDLPWLFRSVWKLVRSWLPEEAQQTVHLITSKQLVEFIDEDQIPNSMKINELAGGKKAPRGRHKLPENFDSLMSFDEQAVELKLSSIEIKQFKCHLEKVLKEYEQLGAI